MDLGMNMMNLQNKFSVGTRNTYYTQLALVLGVVLILALLPTIAQAGGGGGEFDEVWEQLKDWTQGTLGRIIAGCMIIVGIVGGIARQSLMAFAMGAGGGVGLYNSPGVIESIMTATVAATAETATQIQMISNGLGM